MPGESERYYLLRLRHLEGLTSPEAEAAARMTYVGALQRLGDAVAINDRYVKLADLVPAGRPTPRSRAPCSSRSAR